MGGDEGLTGDLRERRGEEGLVTLLRPRVAVGDRWVDARRRRTAGAGCGSYSDSVSASDDGLVSDSDDGV